MNTPEIINIEKYAEALNNLIGVDSAYYKDDKDVDAIVELIVAAKKLENRVKELEAEKDSLIKNYAGCMRDYAREIFEDIENVLSENFHADCIMGDCVEDYYDDNLRDDIAELKKKYGGDTNDGE